MHEAYRQLLYVGKTKSQTKREPIIIILLTNATIAIFK